MALTADGSINMWKPRGKIVAREGTVGVGTFYNANTGSYYPALHFGNPSGTPGITLSNYCIFPAGFGGDVQFVQVVTDTLHRFQTNDGSADWYRLLGEALKDDEAQLNPLPDSPGSSLDFDSGLGRRVARNLLISDSFETTLEFRPPSGHWVPLRGISWEWGGEAFLNGNSGSPSDYAHFEAKLSTTDTNAAKFIEWSPRQLLEDVPGNPFQKKISKANSEKYLITASLGSKTLGVNLWIIWSTISFQFSGETPANAQSLWLNVNPDNPIDSNLQLYCPGYDLGMVPYLSNLYPYTSGGIGYAAWAKMCAIATATPAGVHQVASNGWGFVQQGLWHEFKDGVPNTADGFYFDGVWQSDGPFPWRATHSLDSEDKLYTIDAPLIQQNWRGSTVSYEDHQNFLDYVTWMGVVCSETNYWHMESQWKAGRSPSITPTTLGPGTNSLPVSPWP